LKNHLEKLIADAVLAMQSEALLPEGALPAIQISRTRDAAHGDYACNLALMLAKSARRKPLDIAAELVARLPASERVAKVEVAPPGFINFFEAADSQSAVVRQVLEQGEQFGRSDLGAGKRIQVEFVSANPTGPLHVGHGRGAATGAVISNLMDAAGFDVQREYYVNDAGRQMDILAASTWLRYLELAGETIVFPSNAYRGDYIWDVAATVHRENEDALRHPIETVMQGVPADLPDGGDAEAHIDGVIARAKALLGDDGYRIVFNAALDTILDDIRRDLSEFRVEFDEWLSERSLVDAGDVSTAIDKLKANGYLREESGALWFKSTEFGDEKDRVVVRDNGQPTYFASDLGYLNNKFARGFERVIYVWGADHHGYVKRLLAGAEALGHDPSKIEILLVQLAALYRGGEKVKMSTRSGEFVTLRELRDEVGADAARFFYTMRRCEQHMDFDLDLAKSESSDNPVYYVQYAHARVCSVLRQLEGKQLTHNPDNGNANLGLLTEIHETELMTMLGRYPEVVQAAATAIEPHQITAYLRELANAFHTYYNAQQFLVDDAALRDARLNLVVATRQVMRNGLALIDVTAPEAM
jgi:arginyl-tRNA synthetase